MARCSCRWRNVLICLCTPCILLALLCTYTTVMLCYDMINTRPEVSHFIAQGIYMNNSLVPLPRTFWDLRPNRGGVWNQLQVVIDRFYNPILNPQRTTRESKRAPNPLLRDSFTGTTVSENRLGGVKNLSKRMREFVKYMQRKEYPITIEPDAACGAGAEERKEPPLLLLAIKTKGVNFENRQAIRQSWGQVGWVSGQRRNSSGGLQGGGARRKGGGYIRRVFLLGREDYEELGVNMSELLQLESIRYGDILQWDFKDTFFNLTLKDVLFWDWFSRLCGKTRFVFKGDDDVFLNTPAMVDYLQDQLGKPGTRAAMRSFMVGDVIAAATPDRRSISKYFIPDMFYKGIYPTYAGGGGVVYSGLLAKRLNDVSKRVHLFPIDDVYVGMCMRRLGAFPTHHPAFLTFDFPKGEENEPCAYHEILVVHRRKPSQVITLWGKLKDLCQCWNVTLRDTDTKIKKKLPIPGYPNRK